MNFMCPTNLGPKLTLGHVAGLLLESRGEADAAAGGSEGVP